MNDPRNRRLLALLVFMAVLGVDGFSLLTHRQLGFLGGLTDEWDMLGANLAVHGTLGLEEEPWVLRPPGYPAFIAGVLKAAGTPRVVTGDYLLRTAPLVYAAQALILATSAVLLFLWLSRGLRTRVALAAALLFGLNPYCVVLTGLLHYDILHMFFLIAGCYSFPQAPEKGEPPLVSLFLSGVLWGVTTLVRSLTLPLPAFLFFLFLGRPPGTWRSACRQTAVFLLGLSLAIAPWTWRNYRVSRELIPVNLQAWSALWGSTVKPLSSDPNHYRWFELGPDLERVFLAKTGEAPYSLAGFVRHNAQLERGFREEALRNLRAQPQVYAGNAIRSLLSLNFQVSSVLLKAFQQMQGAGVVVAWEVFGPGAPQEFGSAGLAAGFSALAAALALLSLAALVIAVRTRDPLLLGPGLVYLCLILVQGLTYMDVLYYYLKMPFQICFAAYAIDRLADRGPRLFIAGHEVSIAEGFGTLLTVTGIALTLALL